MRLSVPDAQIKDTEMKNPILVLTLYSIHRQLGTPWREAIALAWRQA